MTDYIATYTTQDLKSFHPDQYVTSCDLCSILALSPIPPATSKNLSYCCNAFIPIVLLIHFKSLSHFGDFHPRASPISSLSLFGDLHGEEEDSRIMTTLEEFDIRITIVSLRI